MGLCNLLAFARDEKEILQFSPPMIRLSEAEIQSLIEMHNNQKKVDEEPAYGLKEILEMGINYLYARDHMVDGKVVPCNQPFSILKKHTCKEIEKPFDTGIENSTKLEMAKDAFCWTGSNLAILTSDNNLFGYYRSSYLFDTHIENSSKIVATCDSIFIGMRNGDVTHFDPITQSLIEKKRHSDIITSMEWTHNKLLTGSLDGSIFYDRKMDVGSPVLDVKYVREDRFFCSCMDNTVCIVDNEEVRRYLGHTDRIKSISYGKVGVSTSSNGQMGILHKDQFEIINFGCSMHKRGSPHQLVGYGMNDIILYDLNVKKEGSVIKTKTQNLSIYDNLIAFSTGSLLRIIDKRNVKDNVIEYKYKEEIRNLEFSDTGDMLLVCTDDSPYLCELNIRT